MSTIQVIKPDAITTVEISGYMLQKFQESLLAFFGNLSDEKKETFQRLISDEQAALENQDETLDIGLHLMFIISAAEQDALEKGLIVEEPLASLPVQSERSDLTQNPSTAEQL